MWVYMYIYTFQVMGNASEFKRAVQLVIEQVSFDKPSTVQVFEATIRYNINIYLIMQ